MAILPLFNFRKEIMITLQNIAYTHPNRDLLFSNINLSINKQDKIALIGNNGEGKSTLLQLLAGRLQPSEGIIKTDSQPYYVPQHFGQYNSLTVAQALSISDKLTAFKEILIGNVTNENLIVLNDDWGIEERCNEAFEHWKLKDINLEQPMSALSGGQKTRIFLAGILIHQPDIVLLDEPSNHLDTHSRELLYQYIKSSNDTLVVVSHDRTLLNLITMVCELSKKGLSFYGGNYEFYAEQKQIENNALSHDIKSRERALRKARDTEKEVMERRQKLDARGKKKQEKAGLPTISMNTLKNNAEKSTSKIKGVHTEKVGAISQELQDLKQGMQDADKMKVNLDNSLLRKGKVLFTARDINFGYNEQMLWKEGVSFQIVSGGRLALKGINGSGKSTLIKIILGELQPVSGVVERGEVNTIYIDQDYSLINNKLSVFEQAGEFNTGGLQEHDIKMRLNRFLFMPNTWDKPCSSLSGGEKMRLMLCCLTIASQAPDMIVLDEPTNNLDIQNLEILTAAISEYQGTLIVISHDDYFLKEIVVESEITLQPA